MVDSRVFFAILVFPLIFLEGNSTSQDEMASLWGVLYSLLCAFPWCASSLVKPAVHQSLLSPATDNVDAAVMKPNGIGEPGPFGVGMDLSSSYGSIIFSPE
jgi:hypothetical protein